MTTRNFGAPIRRNEDARLLSGQALFVDDVELPGVLYAAFLRSNVAHARIRSIDITAALAQHILQSKATDFDPSQFVDNYEEAVAAMLKKKQAGITVSRERAAPRSQNVVNLVDALRRSIAQEKAASAPPKKGRKRIEGQGEMLLPISGKRGKEAAKPAERPSAHRKKVG